MQAYARVRVFFQKIATYKESSLDHNNTRTREKHSRRSSGKRREII
jgi:hypothetical protein